jgi:hypothetical protein
LDAGRVGDAVRDGEGLGDGLGELDATGNVHDVQYHPLLQLAAPEGPLPVPTAQILEPPLAQTPQLDCPMQPPHVVALSQLEHWDCSHFQLPQVPVAGPAAEPLAQYEPPVPKHMPQSAEGARVQSEQLV